MKRLRFQCSVEQFEKMLGLRGGPIEGGASVAYVRQGDYNMIEVGLLVQEGLMPPDDGNDLVVESLTQVGDALANPAKYFQPTKGPTRGGE